MNKLFDKKFLLLIFAITIVCEFFVAVSAIAIPIPPPVVTINNPNTDPAQSKTITASIDKGSLKMSNTTDSICNGTLDFIDYSEQTFSAESDNNIKVCYRAKFGPWVVYEMSDAILGIDITAASLAFADDVESGPVWKDNIEINYGDAAVKKYKLFDSAEDCAISVDASVWSSYVGNFSYTDEDSNSKYICVYAEDSAGNKSVLASSNSLNIKTDEIILIDNPDVNPAQSKIITALTNLNGVLKMSETTGDYCGGDEDLVFIDYDSITYTLESDNGKKVCYQVIDQQGNNLYEISDAIGGIDTTAPIITVPDDIIVSTTDVVGMAVAYTAISTDNVDEDITPTCEPASESVFPAGNTEVTCNASDTAGNLADPVTFIITVNLESGTGGGGGGGGTATTETLPTEEIPAEENTNDNGPADINQDGFWDDLDFSLMVSLWGQATCSQIDNWCSRADLNQDGLVDDLDFSILITNWS